jgi:putative hydrolase of the HAD superfamily
MSGQPDSRARIRVVLFDFGGVLAEEGFQRGLQALAEKQGLDVDEISREGRKAVHDSGYVTGTGSESDFWALLRQRTGLAGTDAELTREILDRFRVRPWMLEHAERLRGAGFITAILSDQTDWLERLDQSIHFSRAFDRVFNSYRVGKSKRDPSLFNDVLNELGVAPGEALFVDDNAGHIQRARDRGLIAIRFENRDDFETQFQSLLGERASSGYK